MQMHAYVTTLFSYIEKEVKEGGERLGYLMEAILLILAVVLPLSFVLIFLRRLISNLGDATTITKLQERDEKKE
ncbi:hypothetical protein DT426_09830 [Bacillus cereus]|uniref:Uncharacterized protein n=1 Tax=Bacillus cereus TaxID=1396 RepID=A0A9W7Q7L1_BACCE|nr:hypothetical protein Bt4C1_10015 [Bacillus thuringiensis serovar alesti]AXR16474.1 hypothetical protein DOS87_10240 [Bacillus sp. CR71]AXR22207.1 hypothetical protein DPQ26_10230 [Bacillus sp. E25]AZV65954.1 hypothetical protein DT426_09830 [Bacillus cereus]KAA0797774.1 hypothetical protein DN406_08960 [Bacillus sp. BB56-3]KAA0829317.1 hypothetical protein DN403_06415 [Bacillus sp. AY2-1]KRD86632.1 hypothetical protein ASE53_08230 [Bacillus sp. Root11]KRD96997.1 hypothetical protein ASE54